MSARDDFWDDEPLSMEEYLQELKESARNPYEQFPIAIEVTETKLVWVEGESVEKIIQQINDDGDWYEYLPKHAPTLDFAADVVPVPDYAWHGSSFQEAVYTVPMGPLWKCDWCPSQAQEPRFVIHHKNCPNYIVK